MGGDAPLAQTLFTLCGRRAQMQHTSVSTETKEELRNPSETNTGKCGWYQPHFYFFNKSRIWVNSFSSLVGVVAGATSCFFHGSIHCFVNSICLCSEFVCKSDSEYLFELSSWSYFINNTIAVSIYCNFNIIII